MKSNIKSSIFATCLVLLFSLTTMASTPRQGNLNEENVIAQMNYCIMTLTNIVHNKNMSVLEHESDQIVNNLTMEQITGLSDVRDFRVNLLDAISKFEITEEERALLKRIHTMKNNNLKWSALSNALDPTMLLVGNAGPGMGYQLVFQTLLSAARTTVEYNALKGDQNIEQLQSLWELRKSDLEQINEVRKNAINIVFNLYEKYHLNENDRLTEATADALNDYVNESDAGKRVRLLLDNYNSYKRFAPYYYYLGMAFIDLGKYDKARFYFDKYQKSYSLAPILRYDEMSGCIALAKLAYDNKLSDSEKQTCINTAITNLPNSSAAILQCSMIYLKDLKNEVKAYNLLRAGIDNPNATDCDLLVTAAACLMPSIAKFPTLYFEITSAIDKCDQLGFDAYSAYLMSKTANAWNLLNKLILFDNVTKRHWYCLWLDKQLNDKLQIVIPEKYLFNLNDIYVYMEHHGGNELKIQQLGTDYGNSISEEDINHVDCFKENKNLKYLFFDVLVPNKEYRVKKILDYDKIKDGSWPRMSEFVLSDDDVKDIIKFCKKKTPTTQDNIIKCKRIKSSKEDLDSVNGVKVVFRGDSLLYKPHHAFGQKGDYLRIVFRNGENILYKYDSKSGKLSPYMYETKNKRVFVNSQCKKEYTTLETSDHDKEKVSWLKSVWSGICSACIWIWNGICWIGIKIWAGLVWLWNGICWVGVNIWHGMVWLWNTIIFWK